MSIKNKSPKSFKNTYLYKSKKLIVPFIFSLLLGLFLGFFILFLFPNIGDELPEELTTMVNNKEDHKENNLNEDLESYRVDPITTSVLQAGVFSSDDNAKQWMDNFKATNKHPNLWERDSHFYLFLGIASSKEGAARLKESLFEEDVDIYIKEWEISSGEILVNRAEKDWIDLFLDSWKEALDDHRKFADWNHLFKKAIASEEISDFSSEIKNLLEEYDYTISQEANYILIEAWKNFEEMIEIFKHRKI